MTQVQPTNPSLCLSTFQDEKSSKAKVNDFLAEIFKKIGSKENTKEVRGKALSQVGICFMENGP